MQRPEGLSFFGHLNEVRARLFHAALAWAAVSAAIYGLRDEIYAAFVQPVGSLAYLGPAGAFMIHMKLALFLAAALVLPYWAYQVWAFVSPAMEAPGRRLLAWGSGAVLALFYGGMAFGWLLVGRTVAFLGGFASETLRPMVTTDAYFGFVLALVGGCGLIFQMPVVVAVLVRLGLASSSALKAGWRQALLGSLVLSALVTPSPDAITQVLLAGPIYLLYLFSIVVAVFVERREIEAAMEAS